MDAFSTWSFFRKALTISLRRRLHYRADFALGVLADFAELSLTVIFFGVIHAHLGQVAGKKAGYVLLLVGFVQAFKSLYRIFFAGGNGMLALAILGGRLDRLLLNPIPVWASLILPQIKLREAVGLVPAIALMVVGEHRLHLDIPSLAWVTIAIWLGFAAVLRGLFGFCITCLSFWFSKVEAITALGDQILDLAQLPRRAIPVQLRWVLTYVVPVLVLGNIPVTAFIGAMAWTKTFAMLSGFVLALLGSCWLLWKLGTRSYCSAGG